MKLRLFPFGGSIATLAGLLLFAAPGHARAQDAVCTLCGLPDSGTAAATTTSGDRPLTISIESEVDFDKVLLTGTTGARVRMTPQGERVEIAGVEILGARAFAGQMLIRGEPNRPVVIDLPQQMDLESAAGTSVRIERITSDAPHNPTLDSNGMLVVNFGGDLVVTGDTDGEFRGNLRVDVNYL